MQPPFPLRVECPPGACICERERLLADPDADLRALRLTKAEEARLIDRIERVASYAELLKVQAMINAQLGVTLRIAPGPNEVRSARGIVVVMDEQPGLCKKIRQSVPAAIRRTLAAQPQIVYAILDANDLFGNS
ncbi:MAG: hypothetical protein M3Y65_20105 [Pseudomonadota bacterium]|nr:hypothetical protein [Pseudomonadota bacterium]